MPVNLSDSQVLTEALRIAITRQIESITDEELKACHDRIERRVRETTAASCARAMVSLASSFELLHFGRDLKLTVVFKRDDLIKL